MTLTRWFDTLTLMAQVNGVRWTSYVAVYAALRKIRPNLRLRSLDHRIKRIEVEHGLQGIHAKEIQESIWDSWDWSSLRGEEWTQSEEWRAAVVENVLKPRVPGHTDVLEIGPGAGRWTEALVRRAASLTLVDISSRCLEVCQARFGHHEAVSFFKTTGSDLSFLDDESIDVVWSFDVFVHIAPDDIRNYLSEISRVLRKGGKAIIHHADKGGVEGGWRSSISAEWLAKTADRFGLDAVEQFDSWGEGLRYGVSYYQDCVSVLRKPIVPRDRPLGEESQWVSKPGPATG